MAACFSLLAPPWLRFPRLRSSLVVLLACPISALRWDRCAFLECRLDSLADDAFRSLTLEPASKNGHNSEHILHQFLARLQLLGQVKQFHAEPQPTKPLLQR